jgi:tetratricopeptide (TPR) repeat protein
MPTQPIPTRQSGTCFVVMGFGKKTDFETGRVLDLDKSYINLIKPAVEAAGLMCIRADEIVHSGLIDVPMYEQLLKADVVVADVSTSNRNALYELGVRHALRPFTTIIIAEEEMMKSPTFDLDYLVIRKYRHLGEDISVSEARRFTIELVAAIQQILATAPERRADSPVYKFIARLTPPLIAADAKARGLRSSSLSGPDGIAFPPHSELMQRVDETQRKGDWLKAKMLLEEIREMRRAGAVETSADQQGGNREDPYVLQRLALATYKSKYPTPEEALKAARDLLKLLEPQTSNDTETLGLWGSVHRRLWEVTNESSYLDEALYGYERAFSLRKDSYNGINYAFLLNTRAVNTEDSVQASADVAEARRAYQEVVKICDQWLESNVRPGPLLPGSKFPERRYWVLAMLAEAHYGLGDDEAEQRLQEAYANAPEPWMKASTEEQLAKLRELLANLPSNRRFTTKPPTGKKQRKKTSRKKSELASALDRVGDESVVASMKEFQDLFAEAKGDASELVRQNAEELERRLVLLKNGQIDKEDFDYFVENQKRDLRVFVDSQPAQAQERAEKLTLQVLELATTKVVPVLIRPV